MMRELIKTEEEMILDRSRTRNRNQEELEIDLNQDSKLGGREDQGPGFFRVLLKTEKKSETGNFNGDLAVYLSIFYF